MNNNYTVNNHCPYIDVYYVVRPKVFSNERPVHNITIIMETKTTEINMYTETQKIKIFKRAKLRIKNGHMTKKMWFVYNKFINEITTLYVRSTVSR